MDGKIIRRILRYALPANMIMMGGSYGMEWSFMMGTMSCQVFNQPVKLFVDRAFVDIFEP